MLWLRLRPAITLNGTPNRKCLFRSDFQDFPLTRLQNGPSNHAPKAARFILQFQIILGLAKYFKTFFRAARQKVLKHLAGKRGRPGKYFALFFVFFRVCEISCVASPCVSMTSVGQNPPKKIIPEIRWKVFRFFGGVT